MKWAIALIGMCCSLALGHPGNAIAVAEDGTVYFGDVAREIIWRIDPDGEPVAILRNHWTHTVFIGHDGEVYFEREESRNGSFPCSLWRLGPDDKPIELIEAQQDRRAFSGTNFVIDQDGFIYYPHTERNADNEWRTRIMRRTLKGDIRVFAGGGDGALYTDGDADTGTIRIITAMTMDNDGVIWFADRDHVRRVPTRGERAGHIETIAAGLIDANPKNPPDRRGPATTINRLYGIGVDLEGRALIAYKAGRRVVRVSADGSREVVFRSERDWSPIGVAGANGRVYVLEVHDDSIESLRVWVIEDDGTREVLAGVE